MERIRCLCVEHLIFSIITHSKYVIPMMVLFFGTFNFEVYFKVEGTFSYFN